MNEVFIDTNVFLYSLGREHPYREPCRAVVEQLSRGDLVGVTDVLVIAEFSYVRGLGRGPNFAESATLSREICQLMETVHSISQSDLSRALELNSELPELRPNDALHAAVALDRGIKAILTADRDFEAIDELERIDPVNAATIAPRPGASPSEAGDAK